MKPQIALAPDQMHELQLLGLDCSDASMVWKWKGETEPRLHVNTLFDDIRKDYERFGYTPAYTLEDILMKLREFLPRYEISPNNWSHTFYKIELPCEEKEDFSKVFFIKMDDSLASAFEALKWVLKNHPDKIKKLER